MKTRTTIVKSLVLSLCLISGIYLVSKHFTKEDNQIKTVKQMIMVDENTNNDENMGEENESLIKENVTTDESEMNKEVTTNNNGEVTDESIKEKVESTTEEAVDNKDSLEELEPAEKIISNIGYKIQPGDTIYDLAKKYNTTSEYIFANNKEKNLKILKVGEEIEIPSEPGIFYKVQKGDSYYSLEKEFNVTEETIKNDNGVEELMAGDTIFLREPKIKKSFRDRINDFESKYSFGKSFFQNPLNKMFITSSFGMRDHPVLKRILRHGGLDLRARMGTEVMAAYSGVVTYAGRAGTYGNLVIIKHKNGYETRYAHLSKVEVRVGQRVNTRQFIALSGETGRVTGPHLHFEIRKNGKVLNPINFLAISK
ncbi:peptidoglycan DD-metalloendopeptidase family protein [Cetobacterium sp. SF1]|uniref:LysM peptidoglycan-binding domain-containing M23 family metallopeptidase n=1 Tax=Cetobacterium sp. SF1 TaxID=3417654 RepID=UPI003CF6B179